MNSNSYASAGRTLPSSGVGETVPVAADSAVAAGSAAADSVEVAVGSVVAGSAAAGSAAAGLVAGSAAEAGAD